MIRPPVSPSDAALAAAVWDETIRSWNVGPATAEGERVRASVEPEGGDARDRRRPVTAEARAALDHFAERAGALRTFAADDEIVRLFNEAWRESGEPITREGLLAALRPGAPLVEAAGRITVYFDTGDLFGGHWLTLDLAPDGTPVGRPDLAG